MDNTFLCLHVANGLLKKPVFLGLSARAGMWFIPLLRGLGLSQPMLRHF